MIDLTSVKTMIIEYFFMIPYEDKFTLIGTTDIDHGQSAGKVEISEEEKLYICKSANEYLNSDIGLE